jgi:hypothetical protein
MAAARPRKLELKSLDEAVLEAERLLNGGYRSAGNWNLAQTLGHCSDWLRFPIDGYPRSGFPVNLILTILRWTIGKSSYHKIMRDRGFKAGSPTMPETVKKPDAKQDAEALREFDEVVKRFQSFSGEPHPSPLFGKLSLEQMRDLQVIHLQHHLSFLLPRE